MQDRSATPSVESKQPVMSAKEPGTAPEEPRPLAISPKPVLLGTMRHFHVIISHHSNTIQHTATHCCPRPLAISPNESYISAQVPHTSQIYVGLCCGNITLHIRKRAQSIPQRAWGSCRLPSPIYPHKSPTYLQQNPTHPHRTQKKFKKFGIRTKRIRSQCIPQKVSIIHTATHCCPRSLAMSHESCISAQVPHISETSPYISAGEPNRALKEPQALLGRLFWGYIGLFCGYVGLCCRYVGQYPL